VEGSVDSAPQGVTRQPRPETRGIVGIWGRPFVSLEDVLDLSLLSDVHEEICSALARLPVSYTGGCHRSMGIMPERFARERFVDYGEVIARMTEGERRTFVSLADDPAGLGPEDARDFGEEREHPLSRRQMLWLKYRFGVYFPWQVYYEMIPNQYWDEKSSGSGKSFTREARACFPRTIELVQSLPFVEVGRCNVMGLDPMQHGTVHRDGDPAIKPGVDHFITLCPAGNKRLFLWDDAEQRKVPVTGRAYWFNDSDYHGVEADPFFRYSIRIDGVFDPDFLRALEESNR
jgi:hypothetical protein